MVKPTKSHLSLAHCLQSRSWEEVLSTGAVSGALPISRGDKGASPILTPKHLCNFSPGHSSGHLWTRWQRQPVDKCRWPPKHDTTVSPWAGLANDISQVSGYKVDHCNISYSQTSRETALKGIVAGQAHLTPCHFLLCLFMIILIVP